MNQSYTFMKEHFEEPFYGKIAIFTNAEQEVLDKFCPQFIEDLKEEYSILQMFSIFVIINTLGMLTSVTQKLTIFRVKDNVTLNYIQMGLETSIVLVGVLVIFIWNESATNTMVSDKCGTKGEDAD